MGGVTPPRQIFCRQFTQFAIFVGQYFYFFVFLEHNKKNQVLWRNGKLVDLLHSSMNSSHISRYSSIMGTKPIFVGKMQVLHPPPQEKDLGTALLVTCNVSMACLVPSKVRLMWTQHEMILGVVSAQVIGILLLQNQPWCFQRSFLVEFELILHTIQKTFQDLVISMSCS